MSNKNKIDGPNYTQVPNALLGDIGSGNRALAGTMATLTGSQVKVFLSVCRLTFGFHQVERRASLTMMQKFTGLSRQGVIDAANELEALNMIVRERDGGVTLWRVGVVNSVDQGVNSVDQGVNSVDQGVNSVDSHLRKKPLKETLKETLEIPDFEILWSSTLDQLRETMTRATFETNLARTHAVALDGDTLTVAAEANQRDWLDSRLIASVSRAAGLVAGRPVQVQFVSEPANNSK